jgi:hypothetical protein
MKTMITMIGMLLVFSYVGAQDDKSTLQPEEVNKIEITWTQTVHDFKDIPARKPVTASFEFENKGKEPITVTKVRSSCGCTVANYSKEPVLPGKTGQVSATYNAVKHGAFNKSVTVYMSDNTQYRLSLKGNVEKAE